MILIIGCNKGGAGKTTSCVNVAVALSKLGSEVCLVDADVQRSAARWHAEREYADLEPRVTLVEKQGNISETLKTLAKKFDHVIVDVAGRNSRELITGATVADIIVAPHQCSQLDLDTMSELQEQITRIRDLNPGLKVLGYHAMASTNAQVKDIERQEFLKYLAEFPEIEAMNSIGYYRKIYKDVIGQGKSVLEADNQAAINEINSLVEEILNA